MFFSKPNARLALASPQSCWAEQAGADLGQSREEKQACRSAQGNDLSLNPFLISPAGFRNGSGR